MYKINRLLFSILWFVLFIGCSKQSHAKQAMVVGKAIGNTIKSPLFKKSTEQLRGKEFSGLVSMVNKSKKYLPFLVGGGISSITEFNLIPSNDDLPLSDEPIVPNLKKETITDTKKVEQHEDQNNTLLAESRGQEKLYDALKKRIIFGVGNPGKEYQRTRHNIGLMLVDYQVNTTKRAGTTFIKSKNSFAYETLSTIYLRSNKYMPLTGRVIKRFVKAYPEYKSTFALKQQLHVAHDVLELKPGLWTLKDIWAPNPISKALRRKGREGMDHKGHHGVKSIVENLGGVKDFRRICIGIGCPLSITSSSVKDYVHEEFSLKDLGIYHDKVFPEISKYLQETEICPPEGPTLVNK